MRPPEFTGGKLVPILSRRLRNRASMRPPEFTGGKKGVAGVGFHIESLEPQDICSD